MKNIVGWLLLLAAQGFYLYGIASGIECSWSVEKATEDLTLPAPLEAFTTALGAILLANFGAALGISLQQRQSAIARSMGLFRATLERKVAPPASSLEKIQQVAVLIYLITLIACLVTWIHNEFSTDPKDVVPLIYQGANTFFGILTAYVASLLSPPFNNLNN